MTATARPERQILRVADLQAQLGLSRTTIWRLRRAGEIPQTIRISPNAVGWPAHVIAEWLAQRPPACGGTALERLVERWAEVAVSYAIVRTIDDPAGLIATVAGIDGAWGFGQSEDEALDDLRSVLVDWASLKLEDGDDDIPSMEGVHLVTAP